MNKKILLALPMVGMMLASCNASAGLPGGYREVDMNDMEQAMKFGEKCGTCLDESFKAALTEGVNLKLHIEVHDFTYELMDMYEDVESGWREYSSDESRIDSVTVDFLKLDLEIKAAHLSESIGSMQASVKIKNLAIKGAVHIQGISGKIDCNDVDISLFAKNGNLYADLTDKDLLELADQVLPVIFGEETNETNAYKAIARIVNGDKYYAKNFPALFGIDSAFVIPFSKLDSYFLEEVKMFMIQFANFCENEPLLQDVVTFADYDDGRIGVLGDAKFDDYVLRDREYSDEVYLETLSVDAMAYLLANRQTRLECIHVEGVAKYYSHEEEYFSDNGDYTLYETEDLTIKGNVEVDLVIKYGVDEIRVPKDKNFEELPLTLLF